MAGLFFKCLLFSVGFAAAFIPSKRFQMGDWSAYTHRVITRSGIWASVVEFLKDNPQYANKNQVSAGLLDSVEYAGLFEGQIPYYLKNLITSSKFEDAIEEIEDANVKVDSEESGLSRAHFDAEQFVNGSRRLVALKKRVIFLIQKPNDNVGDYQKAREETGRYLHTLQDFYSHSNWIEMGNGGPVPSLGDAVINEKHVADPDQRTCHSCTPARMGKQLFASKQVDDCTNNLISNLGKLTSGYGGQDVIKPVNVGKCSHGGLFDDSRTQYASGGINKDSNKRYLSPHYKLHKQAAYLAIKATKAFFDAVRRSVGEKKFARLFNMVSERSFSFVIDTTGSMSGEINMVKQMTLQAIEDSRYGSDTANLYYVLVPFNDPGFGPAYVTHDAEEAKRKVNSLTPHGGGDCEEYGMSGLYLALSNSAPNSEIYFFSDADCKDEHLASSVLSMALKKQCTLTFWSSGRCSRRRKRRSLSGRALYQHLATATGGQLLVFTKADVADMMKLFRRSTNVTWGNLTSPVEESILFTVNGYLSGVTVKEFHTQIDSSILSISVILSADTANNITVQAPAGHSPTIDTVSSTATIYSIRVTNLVAGNWTIAVEAFGSYSIQVIVQSTLFFKSSLQAEEYSAIFGSILVPLSGNPIKGKRLFVTVVPNKPLHHNKNLTARMINVNGDFLGSFELSRGAMMYNDTYYGSIIAGTHAFRLMFIGYDKNGDIIQRVLPRLISPQAFEIKVRLFAEKSSLVISPDEPSSLNVTLYNYGQREKFSILVTDERSFVTSYEPKSVVLNSNGSVNIQINLLTHSANSTDGTTNPIIVSAAVRAPSGSSEDLVNFIALRVSVFSKKFEFINDTALEANLTTFLREDSSKCPAPVDLAFLLDNSRSVSDQQFKEMKYLIKNVTSFFIIKPEQTRVSIVAFSDKAVLFLPFNKFLDHTSLHNVIDSIGKVNSLTYIAEGLNMAYTNMFKKENGARSSEARNVLIVLINGQSNLAMSSHPAQRLKNIGVSIFSVGFGNMLNIVNAELNEMASDPNEKFVVSFKSLTQHSKQARILYIQACLVITFQVNCGEDGMKVVFSKSALPKGMGPRDLHLRDQTCKAHENKTHIFFYTSTKDCGTQYTETELAISFSNMVKYKPSTSDHEVITRINNFEASFACSYDRKRTIGTLSFAPALTTVTGSQSGWGNFTLTMEIFENGEFRNRIRELPVSKALFERIYVQYSLNTSNPDLVVFADSCHATPTNRPYDQPRYEVIKKGCANDKTMRYNYYLGRVQQFSVQAFQFLTKHTFVYLHCDLVICNRKYSNSSCAKALQCQSPRRKRREVDVSGGESPHHTISAGPFMMSAIKQHGTAKPENNNTKTLVIIGGTIIALLILAIVVIIMLMKRRSSRSNGNQVPEIALKSKNSEAESCTAVDNKAYEA